MASSSICQAWGQCTECRGLEAATLRESSAAHQDWIARVLMTTLICVWVRVDVSLSLFKI